MVFREEHFPSPPFLPPSFCQSARTFLPFSTCHFPLHIGNMEMFCQSHHNVFFFITRKCGRCLTLRVKENCLAPHEHSNKNTKTRLSGWERVFFYFAVRFLKEQLQSEKFVRSSGSRVYRYGRPYVLRGQTSAWQSYAKKGGLWTVYDKRCLRNVIWPSRV